MSEGAAMLKAWREQKNMSRLLCSTEIGVSPYYYPRLERGDRKPGRKIAMLIEVVTGIPSDAWDRDIGADRNGVDHGRSQASASPVGRRGD